MENTTNRVMILGSGTSTGVPLLGCGCPVCTHSNPKNKRLRSSIFLKTARGNQILVDAGPDLRTQLLREKITKIDHLILTHDHADHCHGVDDLRPLSQQRPIPVTTTPATGKALTRKFPYIFDKSQTPDTNYTPQLHLLHPPQIPTSPGTLGPPCLINGDSFEFFLNPHGPLNTLAFVHQGKMAYIIDCQSIPPTTLEELKKRNLELLIIDCARRDPHPTHLNLNKALEYARMISPRFCGLTHLSHDFEHEELTLQTENQPLSPLFDGQVLSYEGDS